MCCLLPLQLFCHVFNCLCSVRELWFRIARKACWFAILQNATGCSSTSWYFWLTKYWDIHCKYYRSMSIEMQGVSDLSVLRGSFTFLVATVWDGEARGILLVSICNLPGRCHQILLTRPSNWQQTNLL